MLLTTRIPHKEKDFPKQTSSILKRKQRNFANVIKRNIKLQSGRNILIKRENFRATIG